VLSDPETRRRYEPFGATSARCRRCRPADLAAARAGAGARAGTGPGPDGGSAIPPATSTSRSARRHLRRPRRGLGAGPRCRHEAELELTVEEAYRGVRRSITLAGGDGARRFSSTSPCRRGTDRQRIRLAGQGGRGSDGAPAGTCTSSCGSRRHPRYCWTDATWYTELRLAPWEPPSARRARWHPGGEVQGESAGRDVERPADPAAAAAACPTRWASRATCSPRRGSWCRRLSRAERRLFEQLAAESNLRSEGAAVSYAMVRVTAAEPGRVRRGAGCTRTWSQARRPRPARRGQ